MNFGTELVTLLGLRVAPIGVSFRATAPAGVPRAAKAEPSGCTYWKLAADGQTFYTEAADHHNCPIGAYTHGVDLPAAQLQELRGVIGTMVELGYLRSEEVAGIPRRHDVFGVAVYAPLANGANGTEAPDVVMVRGNAKQLMLLEEAAGAAGVGGNASLMGRPTCAAIPAAVESQRGVPSLGCIGNRVYTELADDELYYALPGKHLGAVVEKLATIVKANQELEKYHRARKRELTA
jgi:uncharacterized protein (DUF169 family)